MTYGFLETTLDTRSADGRNDVLLSELHFRDEDGTLYKVPALAETDGGSTPRLAWLVPGFEPTGKHWFAWILHDSAYRGTLMVQRLALYFKADLNRYAADCLLNRALEMKGMPAAGRAAVFTAVRAGGWRYYRKP